MNEQRRKQIKRLFERVRDGVTAITEAAREELEEIVGDETEAHEARPEGLQEKHQGAFDEVIMNLEAAIMELENVDGPLDDLKDNLEAACSAG